MTRFYFLLFDYLRPLWPFLILGSASYFAHRLVRALERRSDAGAELAELRGRVAQLEEEADATQRDVLRLQAAQDFATQLLSGRIADSR